MRIKATTIDEKDSCTGDDSRVAVRFSLSWEDDSIVWFNLGVSNYYKSEWLVLLSLLEIGARAVKNVTFTHENLAGVKF